MNYSAKSDHRIRSHQELMVLREVSTVNESLVNNQNTVDTATDPSFQDIVNNLELYTSNLSLLSPQNSDQSLDQPSLTHLNRDSYSAFMQIKSTNGSDLLNSDVDSKIEFADSHENMFKIIEESGYSRITKRLRYLHEITTPYDPYDPPMDLTSLKKLGSFFINFGASLPCPAIGICPNTLLQAEWHSKIMSAVMKFLKDGNIRYAAFVKYPDNSQTTQGTDTRENALQEIMPYIKHYFGHE
ncbi:MAG: hypothetical protein OXF84_13400 [Bacteroidetes bacterium]|nr:hypothetical protein [Bacteroidota bacterium]